jgi:hypothetical protein
MELSEDQFSNALVSAANSRRQSRSFQRVP